MKKLLFVFFILATGLYLKAQKFEWAVNFGGNIQWGKNMKTDKKGNIYHIGTFRGTLDFDPGIGIYNLTSLPNSSAMFILKLDKKGNFVWAKSIDKIQGNALDIDAYGNLYITGYFTNTTSDFDPGSGVYNLKSKAGSDMFVVKLNEDGEFVWAKSLGGPKADQGESIEIDSDNNICISGIYGGKVDFDMGVDSFYINSNASNGNFDIFILKLNENGDFIWVKSIGDGLEQKSTFTIATDSSNNICIGGQFTGDIDFNPEPEVFNLTTSPGEFDVFLLKLDENGDFIWVKSIQTKGRISITFDSKSDLYLTGGIENNLNLDTSLSLTSNGSYDILILKLNKYGDFIWAKNFGGLNFDYGTAIMNDYYNNVYITGAFNGTVDFDPDKGHFNLISKGKQDVFILKLNETGDFIWVKSIGGLKYDGGYNITLDLVNNIFVSGEFSDTVDFDPGPDTFNLISQGSSDIFI
ncbi:MAG TPA: hypothetical protein ENK91_07680, partial [Bacteroidetes bacterium]|nr:hypothetical protein [Bacteroidota bacterium]